MEHSLNTLRVDLKDCSQPGIAATGSCAVNISDAVQYQSSVGSCTVGTGEGVQNRLAMRSIELEDNSEAVAPGRCSPIEIAGRILNQGCCWCGTVGAFKREVDAK